MPLNKETILAAYRAADEFTVAADDFLEQLFGDDDFQKRINNGIGSKETAAVRRASMALTRALTNVRRPK